MRLHYVLGCLLLATGCAGSRVHQALQQRTEPYVFDQPLDTVWPVAQALLTERNFPTFGNGVPHHLETAMLTPEGGAPGASTQGGAPAGKAPGGMGPGGGGGRGGGGRGRAGDNSGSALIRYNLDGDVVDAGHCRVRFIHYTRDNMDSPEQGPERDVDLEWELINRVEPQKATTIRQELAAQGVKVP
jgi:hypothetical protein